MHRRIAKRRQRPEARGVTCPHCSASLTRKQRAGVTCDLCKKEFAFDPKDHSLGLHDLRFRRVTGRLGANGTKYTASQLRLALTRKAPAKASLLGLAIVLMIVGGLALVFGTAKSADGFTLAGIGLVLVGIVMLMSALEGPPTEEMRRQQFQFDTLGRWRALYGELPAGLVDEAALAGLAEEERPRQNLVGVVVCPEREILVSLLANGVPGKLRLGLLGTAPPADAWEKDLLELLRKDPRLPVFLLHDASAAGIFLARDLPQTLGLSPEHRIYDLGLNPKKSIAKKRFTESSAVSPEVSARLDREAPGADVAGSRPIRRGRAQVSPEEMAWLKAGNCAPVLAVPPASLIKRLEFALGKLASMKKGARPEGGAIAAAGFMS